VTDCTEPGPVTAITATSEKDSVSLTWSGPVDQEVTYQVQLKDKGTEFEVNEATTVFSGLQPATPYTFVVVPVCGGTRGDAQEHKFFTSKNVYIYFPALLFVITSSNIIYFESRFNHNLVSVW